MNRSNRAGAATGNGLVILSILSLGAALLYPILTERRVSDRLESAVQQVDDLRSAAQRFHDNSQSLPARTPVGEIPQELLGLLTPEFTAIGTGYALEWGRWDFAEEPEEVVIPEPVVLPEEESVTAADTLVTPPPTLHSFGSISVHSADTSILVGLLGRYGGGASFVRDTTWTLLLPYVSAAEGSPSGN